MAEEKFSLKDHLFNKNKVTHLAILVKRTYPKFEDRKFIQEVLRKFPNLELKARIVYIRTKLCEYLPSEYSKALKVLLKALPPDLDPKKHDDDFGDFIYAPFNDFVATYGCTQDRLEASLSALEQMTKRFSCEDAIRYFIVAFEVQTLHKMSMWSKSSNYHVRRLASEGSRPLLPWSARVHLESAEVIAKILDNLYTDPTRYVVRSVANHLNDISKQDAMLVVTTLKRWAKENKIHKKQSEKELAYLIRHSLRTLLKQGNGDAMNLLGYKINHGAIVNNLTVKNNKLKMGESLKFSFDIVAPKEVCILIDYTMHFASKNGNKRSKVYKLKDVQLKAGEKITLNKKHPLRANMSTIKLYKGAHRITLQVNGVVSESAGFVIK